MFSFVGMKTLEVPITQDVINVQMEQDVVGVDEVVVVAYGTQRKEAKTGSVATVTNEQLADVPAASFDKALSGKMAGVSVTGTSGQPGAASQIRIRGTSSINAGNEPLYVIDGVPVMSGDQSYFTNTSNALSMLNPNDIESVTVLKDAAAASVYGSRAANGVILITTKNGSAGKTVFTARAKYGFSQLANDNNYGTMKPEQLWTYMRTAVRNAGYDPDDPSNGSYYVPKELLNRPLTNWMDVFTKNGKNQEYEFSANGGDEKTRFFTSASYQNTEGVFYGVDFEKMQFRANLDHQVNEKLSLGSRINAAYMESNDVAMQSLYYANPVFAGMLILPWTPLYGENGLYNLDIPENANTNPRATAEYDDQWSKQYRFLGTMYLQYEPIKDLVIKTNNSAEITSEEGRRYWSPEADYYNTDGTLQSSTALFRQLTTTNTITYNKTFNEVHNTRILAGQEATKQDYWSYYLYSPHVDPDIPYPTTSTSDADEGDYDTYTWTLMSYFGILDYNYDGKYYLQASVRADGSSRFGANTRWGTFYSVGASWNLHRESFMESVSWVNLLKVRGSYGINGNNNIGNYEQFGVYSPVQYNGISGLAPNRPANPDLSWEINTAYNGGVDFVLWDRVTGSLDYYYRLTSDMLLDTPLSETSGFSSIRKNIGEMSNEGVEAQIDVAVLNGAVKWNVGGNISHNKTKILELGDPNVTDEEFIDPNNSRILYKEGRTLFTYYLYEYAGVNPVNGEALWYDEDGRMTNDYNKARRIYAGSPEPKFYGGVTSDLSWKGLALNLVLEYKTGNQVLIEENRYVTSDGYNWNSNQGNTGLGYWTTPGQITSVPKPIANNASNSSYFRNTRWMQNGDYLRVKNVTLSYSLPKKWMTTAGLDKVRIYASGLNVYTFHDVDYWDPERGVQGGGFGIYPMTKTVIMGVDITF
jgi:TonB-linked SusC/RagA family outer membrane protein